MTSSNKANRYEDGSMKPFDINYTPNKGGTFVIDIQSEIICADQFADAIKVLTMVDEDCNVIINLQTNGGSLGAADALIHAMRKCECPIHVVATGGVHSAGSLILLEADSYELSEGFHSLIHCGSTGSGGNYNEFAAHTRFSVPFLARVFRSAYEGFLTEQEIDSLLEGHDIWLDGEGWQKRYSARNEYFKNKIEEFNNLVTEDLVKLEAPKNKPAKKLTKASPTTSIV